MFEIIGISAFIVIVCYFAWGLIICPVNFILKIYLPGYDWTIETLYYPFGILTITFAKKPTLEKMLEELDWGKEHWTYKKYKTRIQERLYFLNDHQI